MPAPQVRSFQQLKVSSDVVDVGAFPNLKELENGADERGRGEHEPRAQASGEASQVSKLCPGGRPSDRPCRACRRSEPSLASKTSERRELGGEGPAAPMEAWENNEDGENADTNERM